jgi:hypothetical protein
LRNGSDPFRIGGLVPRSIVSLPATVRPPFQVFVSGVLQQEGADYVVEEDALVFEGRALRIDQVSGWRWALGAIGVGTYRQDDSVDVRYERDGRTLVAERLPIRLEP